jgi:hypothetical protein
MGAKVCIGAFVIWSVFCIWWIIRGEMAVRGQVTDQYEALGSFLGTFIQLVVWALPSIVLLLMANYLRQRKPDK